MDQQEWEARYRQAQDEAVPPPAALLTESRTLLAGGTALDIAMGKGQNAAFLAACGYRVTGVDRAASAAELAREHARRQGVVIDAVAADMRAYDFGSCRFDLIADFYYLERDLAPRIKEGLKVGGLLFFETYTLDQARFGGPMNEAFLLKPNELLSTFCDLFVIHYFERIEGRKAIASLIARKLA